MRGVLAAAFSMLLPTIAAGSQLFDAHLKAKRTSDGVEVFVLLANHSHRPACYALVTPDITMKHRDGESSIMVSTNERFWEYGAPGPWPIQIVPADGNTYAYPWIVLPPDSSNSNTGEVVSVETTVGLYDCKEFFSVHKIESEKLFETRLTAAIEP